MAVDEAPISYFDSHAGEYANNQYFLLYDYIKGYRYKNEIINIDDKIGSLLLLFYNILPRTLIKLLYDLIEDGKFNITDIILKKFPEKIYLGLLEAKNRGADDTLEINTWSSINKEDDQSILNKVLVIEDFIEKHNNYPLFLKEYDNKEVYSHVIKYIKNQDIMTKEYLKQILISINLKAEDDFK